ncbi:hypothetical protein EB796_014316 [Bugula neritina]|uniref:Uncharacterized protein n=1 Tax=Bugula neritina TaxID=10212 RepID=A0A7J7JND1_BUGNE|nr:hypothetical protein EB796_014316 [Bugula neritina]
MSNKHTTAVNNESSRVDNSHSTQPHSQRQQHVGGAATAALPQAEQQQANKPNWKQKQQDMTSQSAGSQQLPTGRPKQPATSARPAKPAHTLPESSGPIMKGVANSAAMAIEATAEIQGVRNRMATLRQEADKANERADEMQKTCLN